MKNFPYYINEEMLGGEATKEDALRMVEICNEHGYNTEYGLLSNGINNIEEPLPEDWQAALDIISEEKGGGLTPE